MLSACTRNAGKEGDGAEDSVDSLTADDDSGLPEPQYVTNPDEKHILSITDTLYFGDTLKIKFKTPHPKDLGIITPSGKFYFLIYMGSDPKKPSLVDSWAFEKMDYLEIVTDKTEANPWDASEQANKLIFSELGLYEVRLSENLETDDGTPVEVEQVYYGARRN